MRWTRHFTNGRHNPKIRAVEKRFGEAGYARAFKLFEIVGERGGSGCAFSPVIDLRKPPTDLDWLAEEWKITNSDAKETLDFFAEVRLINKKAWCKNIVEVPQMLEYMDEWTLRQLRGRNSRGTPEQLPSNSGKSRSRAEQKQSRAEAEADGKKNMTAAAAAPSLEDKGRKVLKKAWDAIGIEPVGSTGFCGVWEFLYADAKDAPLSVVMERAIQHCQKSSVQVPPPFFVAKHRIEQQESNKETDEVARVGRPTGVREELMR